MIYIVKGYKMAFSVVDRIDLKYVSDIPDLWGLLWRGLYYSHISVVLHVIKQFQNQEYTVPYDGLIVSIKDKELDFFIELYSCTKRFNTLPYIIREHIIKGNEDIVLHILSNEPTEITERVISLALIYKLHKVVKALPSLTDKPIVIINCVT